ncbi:SDR family oxidoreductase [Fredinandcohnia sp. QZ13]|uniref:SDR family oxidoreductase n=1 Tax=Fredinandcohnia sp. QZ13 TaxID=3073144 RepID=UPI002853453A|nr:SDR family oxidoreductase [Fredinandcohnia sp. QZ13]MDR4886153.1 SDR family oxidoreductase [Fredinandcohnia sp. QZ13]
MRRVVIITGAANGIGKGLAKAYAENGDKVVLADMDVEAGNNLSSELNKKGVEAIFIKTDVRYEQDIFQLVNQTYQTYGKIDILINNAGKNLFKSPFDVTVEEWDDVINTNLRSVFLCSREVAKYMKKSGGSIVNIASTRAIMSEPHSEGYAATKGGIVAITHALAASFSEYQITVNAISPGWIETGNYEELREIDHGQHFAKRVGKPADIANSCLYLTDPKNNFVTGINLIVDGGMTRKMIYEE